MIEAGKTVRILSLGAGVQSSAMLLAYLSGGLPDPPSFAVFADTQVEPTSVYTWLGHLQKQASGKIKIITATKGNLCLDHLEMKRSASIPFFIKNADGSQGMAWRQCTKEYKIDMVHKSVRQELGYLPKQRMKHKIQMLIGISTDEASRMKPSRVKWIEHVYPLIDAGWSRADCIDLILNKKIGIPPKSACYVCPYRNNESWKNLKRSDPASFEKAVLFEAQAQAAQANAKFVGVPFLHRSMQPLGSLNFDLLAPDPPLFENECEGMCGV